MNKLEYQTMPRYLTPQMIRNKIKRPVKLVMYVNVNTYITVYLGGYFSSPKLSNFYITGIS